MVSRRGRRRLLTAETLQSICDDVRRGVYLRQAAIAAGISERSFFEWLARGRAVEAGELPIEGNADYLHFLQQLQQARAQARVSAESRVFESNPLAWLRSGPARDRGDGEGWAAPPRSEQGQESEAAVMARAFAQALRELAQEGAPALPGGPDEA